MNLALILIFFPVLITTLFMITKEKQQAHAIDSHLIWLSLFCNLYNYLICKNELIIHNDIDNSLYILGRDA
ncbi:hypothetical protein CW663_03270 [Macrococcoides caseolyticum]|uniref:hypothetical protein n=1 Tax=Macrococcoides caseolyticum TaxID=69966 RepID=UPI000C33EE6D|nr:hypothetical protein [Macrococcus caseolyticus]PKE17399.1 hypothetical protein CW718_04555 [Macrococcus caseolyticus]PKE68338.1 hypothetical protein CW663_03270 [Macrococcus caseolyticus]